MIRKTLKIFYRISGDFKTCCVASGTQNTTKTVHIMILVDLFYGKDILAFWCYYIVIEIIKECA